MILPKGSLDLNLKGGAGTIDETIGQISKGKMTGYILVLGTLEDKDGKLGEITGQLVFKDGSPVLCEAIHNKTSKKGKLGIGVILKAMTVVGNTVELHSKIDVGPPLAFFKECKVLESDLDLTAFKESLKEEEEERKKRAEEMRKREEFKRKVSSDVEAWTKAGFKFGAYPAILESEHSTLETWHKEMIAAVEKCKTLQRWCEALNDTDLEEEKGKLMSVLNSPEDKAAIEEARGALKAKSDDVNDKRRGLKHWVDELKEEGYNTQRIEDLLKGDINTAWNNLTQFMDDIQRLKDQKDELERIAKEDRSKGFSKEVTDIEFLLNDPTELPKISEKMEGLKTLIASERKAKEGLMEEASQLKNMGFDLTNLKKHLDIRLDKFKVEFNVFVNNAYKIGLMKQELSEMDRRDLAEEIDALKSGMSDPLALDSYLKTLSGLKKRLETIAKQREALQSELAAIGDKGYSLEVVNSARDLPIDRFKATVNDFWSKVKELEGLSAQVTDMDHRGLESEFKELTSWLYDIGNVPRVKLRIKELREMIDRREKERDRVKADLAAWEKEGFKLESLREVVQGDLASFTKAHKETSELIKRARELLKKLNVIDTRFFLQEASDARSLIMDPQLIDDANKALDSLKQNVERDRKIRDSFSIWLKGLSKEKWSIDGLERVLKVAPADLELAINDTKRKLGRLKEAFDDVERWDPLESNWLSGEIEGLKADLRKVEGGERALDRYEELKEKVSRNKQTRDNIRKQLDKWKDEGYITKTATEKIDSEISILVASYEELKSRIERLENVQRTFDKLDFKHFRSNAEEIEFKLNDPYMVEQLEKDVSALKERIDADRKRRQEFGERIKDYVSAGFLGAKRLIKVMEEDISIVDLEFRNFDKEVETFKKLLASTGYLFVQDRKQGADDPPEKERNELSEAIENLMKDLSDKQ